jgi:hypothetical protein
LPDVPAINKEKNMSDTIELVRFRLKQDKTTADWLKANEKINDWIKVQPGFRFRSLSETADGECRGESQQSACDATRLAKLLCAVALQIQRVQHHASKVRL